MDNYISQTTKKDILDFVKENDVKFIRLVFCDLFGIQKNISIMPNELETAFSRGISFDSSAIGGFDNKKNSELFLKPEPTTLTLLSWRPQQGRVARFYCSILNTDEKIFKFDSREILKNVLKKCKNFGYDCKIGAECEFYLFKTDEDGNPTKTPFDMGGYFDMAPIDKGENVRREICLTLEDMGLSPESSHHERGPGQNEIDFKFSDALSSADDFMTFKTTVKAIATRNGLFASFLPKPLSNQSGSGMHINLSLHKNGQNIFRRDSEYIKERQSFIAGVLSKTREISLFLNPIPNSYKRLGEFEAPKYISWGEGDRSQLIRIPIEKENRSRMELRSPDPAINPYLAYSLVISAGLWGIENNLCLEESINSDLYSINEFIKNNLEKLPLNLSESIDEAKDSDFVKKVLGNELLERYICKKEKELSEYNENEKKQNLIEHKYFTLI